MRTSISEPLPLCPNIRQILLSLEAETVWLPVLLMHILAMDILPLQMRSSWSLHTPHLPSQIHRPANSQRATIENAKNLVELVRLDGCFYSGSFMSFHSNGSTTTHNADWSGCSNYSTTNPNFNDFERVVDRFVAALPSPQPWGCATRVSNSLITMICTRSEGFPLNHDLSKIRQLVQEQLCSENCLLPDSFPITERILYKRGSPCGVFFCLHGPRSVRLTAVFDIDSNRILFYNSQGKRTTCLPATLKSTHQTSIAA